MEPGGDAEPALPSPSARDWSELPLDTLTSVFAKLGAVDILMDAAFVCHSWLDAAKVPSLWRRLDMGTDNNVVEEKGRSGNRLSCPTNILCAMAMEAVDRSSGQLEVFIGHDFVDDYLLRYIVCRAPSLKILHLTFCSENFNEGFVEAINKFPLLEELKFFAYGPRGRRATYEAVGKSCKKIERLDDYDRIWSPTSFNIDLDHFYRYGAYCYYSDSEEDIIYDHHWDII